MATEHASKKGVSPRCDARAVREVDQGAGEGSAYALRGSAAALRNGPPSSKRLLAQTVRGGAMPELPPLGALSGHQPINLSSEEPSTDTGIEVSGYQSALRLAALRKGSAAGSIASPESSEELDAAIEALRTSVIPPRVSRTRLATASRRRARRLTFIVLATLGVVAGLLVSFGRVQVVQTVSSLRDQTVAALRAHPVRAQR
jgi:hypothetical protein